jgi:hypothetical protein
MIKTPSKTNNYSNLYLASSDSDSDSDNENEPTSVNNFDFDINNYSINELQKFFGLNDKFEYNDIIEKHKNISAIIEKSVDYNSTYKKNINEFLEKAKLNLIKSIVKTSQQEENFIEDSYELLNTNQREKIVNQTSTTYSGGRYTMNKETITFNEVINKDKYLNPLEAYNTNIMRSDLNNIKRKTIFTTIMLNSLYREDYDKTISTDFTIFLPYYFKNVFSIRLSSLQLPNVIYCISKYNKNNSFYIEEENTALGGWVVLPDGNYTPSNFTTVLENAINMTLGSEGRFKVEIDELTFKLTISNIKNVFWMDFTKGYDVNNKMDTSFDMNTEYKTIRCMDVDVTELYKRLGWIMGYRQSVYVNHKSYTTEGLYNGNFTNYLYFTMNDYNKSQSQNIVGMFSKSIIIDNILAMIPINQNTAYPTTNFNFCFNNGSDYIEKKREYFGPVNIQKLKFQLLNQFGELLFLNNMDFSFSLELELAYDW